MNRVDFVPWLFWLCLIFCLFLLVDFVSFQPIIQPQQGKVVSFQPTPITTWIKFSDGVVVPYEGSRGIEGEVIIVNRVVGSESLFGFLGREAILW